MDETGHYVLLRWPSFGLLFEQREVESAQLRTDQDGIAQVGEKVLRWNDRLVPLLKFSGVLSTAESGQATQRYALILRCNDGLFALSGQSIRLLRGVDVKLMPVPICMRTATSPLTAIARQKDEEAGLLLLGCNAQTLWQLGGGAEMDISLASADLARLPETPDEY